MDKLEHCAQMEQQYSACQNEAAFNLVHDLAQPITAISAYLRGCIYRLEHGVDEPKPLLNVMHKIMRNVECAEHILLRIKSTL